MLYPDYSRRLPSDDHLMLAKTVHARIKRVGIVSYLGVFNCRRPYTDICGKVCTPHVGDKMFGLYTILTLGGG